MFCQLFSLSFCLSLLRFTLFLFISLSPVFADINSAIQNYQGTSANGTAKVVSKKRPAISASYKNIRRNDVDAQSAILTFCDSGGQDTDNIKIAISN